MKDLLNFNNNEPGGELVKEKRKRDRYLLFGFALLLIIVLNIILYYLTTS
ncbi:MAG: hypothetical protein IAE91_01840 [Ignavibacteriaceae bacterium]|nr:hypothetical protein [Ignavibacteriaceae bacterium]